jgi:hypothetical protein
MLPRAPACCFLRVAPDLCSSSATRRSCSPVVWCAARWCTKSDSCGSDASLESKWLSARSAGSSLGSAWVCPPVATGEPGPAVSGGSPAAARSLATSASSLRPATARPAKRSWPCLPLVCALFVAHANNRAKKGRALTGL